MKTLQSMVLAATLTPLLCFAEASDFNYVQGGYVNSSVDAAGFENIDYDGFSVEGSLELTEELFVYGDYADISGDDDSIAADIDADAYSVGLGFIFGTNDTATFYGTLAFAEASASYPGLPDVDETGYTFGFGARINTGDRSELEFGADYQDVVDTDNKVTAYAQILYEMFDDVFGYVNISGNADGEAIGVGLRYAFRAAER